MAGTTAKPIDPADHRHGWVSHIANPYFLAGAAVFTGFFWYISTQSQIYTNEAWMFVHSSGGSAESFTSTVHFNMIEQFSVLIFGSPNETILMSTLFGFLVQAIQIVVSLGLGYALQVVNQLMRQLSGVPVTTRMSKGAVLRDWGFMIGTGIIIVWDSITDWSFGPGDGSAHGFFMLVTAVAGFFFLPLTLICARAAWALWPSRNVGTTI